MMSRQIYSLSNITPCSCECKFQVSVSIQNGVCNMLYNAHRNSKTSRIDGTVANLSSSDRCTVYPAKLLMEARVGALAWVLWPLALSYGGRSKAKSKKENGKSFKISFAFGTIKLDVLSTSCGHNIALSSP